MLFEVESHPKYENVNPGIEGFGLEACDLGSALCPREPVTLDYDRTIEPTTQGRVARKLDELQRNTREFSWDSAKDRADLADFIDLKDGGGKGLQMSRLCCFLNSPDQFFELRVMATVEMWTSEPNSILPIMWQVVLGKELIRRLENRPELVSIPDSVISRVLATMIVADLRTKDIQLEYARPPPHEIVPPDRGFHKRRAERYKNEGNDALAKGEGGSAIDLYGVAIRLDPGNAVYHANKSMASYCLGRYRDSANQACVAILIDGKYAKAWSRYGYEQPAHNDVSA